VSLGGAYFSNYQRCVNDALADIELYRKLERETYERERRIASLIAKARSLEELKLSLKNASGFTYYEFRDRSSFDLDRTKNSISRRIDIEEIKRLYIKYNIGGPKYTFKYKDMVKYGQAITGEISEEMSEADLPGIKKLSATLFGSRTDFFQIVLESDYAPNCEPSVLLNRFLGKDRLLYKEYHDIKAFPNIFSEEKLSRE
jgi:hypothetical protein